VKVISPAFASLPLLGVLAAGADVAAVGDGAWRIRDLHLVQLFRGIAEAPRWMHTVHENSFANVALLFASAAVAMVLVLLPLACTLVLLGRRIRNERCTNAVILSVMTCAAIGLSAGAFLMMPAAIVAVCVIAGVVAPERLRRALSWSAAVSLVLIVSTAGESALFPSTQRVVRTAGCRRALMN